MKQGHNSGGWRRGRESACNTKHDCCSSVPPVRLISSPPSKVSSKRNLCQQQHSISFASLSLNLPKRLPLFTLSLDPFPSAEDEAISARNCISRPSLHTPNFEQRCRWSVGCFPFCAGGNSSDSRGPPEARQTRGTHCTRDKERMKDG